MIDNYGWAGIWNIKIIDKLRGEVSETTIKNRVMNTAIDEFLKVLQGTATDMQVKYLALGTGNTAITDNDTKLANEIFRTQVTSSTKTGTGELTTLAIVLDNEAIGNLEEIGIFGGTTATATKDTGKLISRILWSKVKSGTEELQFTRVDKVVRA